MLTNVSPVNARRWQLRCIAAGLLLAAVAAPATTTRNATDYEGILKRNPFNLQAAPPPPPPVPPPAPPPSNIELTGLVTAFGRQQVLMTIKDAKGQPTYEAFSVGEPAKEGIEVLSLDLATGQVRVRNRGVESVLEWAKVKVPVGPAPAAPTPVPVPGIRPPGIPVPQPAPGTPGGIGADGMPAGIGTTPAPAVIPTRSIRVPAVPQGQPTSQATPQLSPEVEAQMVLIELNRMQQQQQQQQSGQISPPLPPTPLTPPQ
jgi:hypothetical protein